MRYETLAKDVFTWVEQKIKQHGPRLAGEDPSRNAADDIYKDLESFSDSVGKDDFYIHQGAFLGWIRILVLAYLVSVVFLWLKMPLFSIILTISAILILVLQFFLYLPLLDRFYPKKLSRNVYGIIEPKEEVKRQVILSGHHDSAHVFNFFIHQPKLYNLRTTGSIGIVIFLLVLSMIHLIFKDVVILNLIIPIIASLGFLLVGQMWFFSSKQVSPGAGDNLVASGVSLVLGKHYQALKDSDTSLKHTRIIMISFDAEEEGLRGARAFARAHQAMLRKVPTTMINMDCLYDEKELFFLTSDLNNFVKLDHKLAEELYQTGNSLGFKTKTQPLAFLTGGTDAAELAKIGVSATTIIGMPWTNDQRSNVYHTPNDTLDHVNLEVVKQTIEIIDTWIRKTDI
ncbi:MAG: M28 family peptidase [Acholeplasma sp.]|jgi:hypothetical protein|nr:MAG: M28 family peptidase [Acholeplasma sp.]